MPELFNEDVLLGMKYKGYFFLNIKLFNLF